MCGNGGILIKNLLKWGRIMGKTCFFIGNRQLNGREKDIKRLLEEEVKRLILNEDVIEFFVGNYGQFDSLVKSVLEKMKDIFPQIKAHMVLPYHPYYVKDLKEPKNFDGVIYPEELNNVPKRLAIVKLNHLMVDRAEYLIAYVEDTTRKSGKLLEYAQKREEKGLIKTVNLAGLTIGKSF